MWYRIVIYLLIIIVGFNITYLNNSKPIDKDLRKTLEADIKQVVHLSKGSLYPKGFRIYIKKKTPRNAIGVCIPRLLAGKPTVIFLEDYLKESSHMKRLMLVAHELIHCKCNRFVHNTDKFYDGCSKSIMDTHNTTSYCIHKHYEYYLDQISRGCDAY